MDEAELRREKKERKREKRERRDRERLEAENAVAEVAAEEEIEEQEKKEKKSKKRKERDASDTNDGEGSVKTLKVNDATEDLTILPVLKQYPPKKEEPSNSTILLFYAYCNPPMTSKQQDSMIANCYKTLSELKITGRLRVAKEGFNATLTGPTPSTRKFTAFLRTSDPATFGQTDFKYVDKQADNKCLRGLKVWAVTEIVTYGFDPADAPLDLRGTHLAPKDFHEAMKDPKAIMIDVRNFNESLIGRFNPPDTVVLDPEMRRSTEFPNWIEKHKKDLEGKNVLMYCTAGVRCERASAFMRNKGVQNVFQLEGGIHRYLDAFPQDGGFWVGKNYTFDKRFSHGAEVSETISHCVVCKVPWDRYQAQESCSKCQMEVLVCKTCQRAKVPKKSLFCPLCKKD